MKLYAECISCILSIRYRDIAKIVIDENRRLDLMKGILKLLNELINEKHMLNTVKIATELYRFIKRSTGVEDIYRDEKLLANRNALELYRELHSKLYSIPRDRDRLIFAMRFSLIGNAIDYGVANYVPPSINELVQKAMSMNIYGNLDEAIDFLLKSKRVVFLLDNAGEAVLDRLLSDTLRSMGKQVIAIVKSGSFQNDITIKEAREAGLYESFDEVIESGSDAASIILEEVNDRVKEILKDIDVVISKGMANYEYLTEVSNIIGKPIVYILMAKCRPIASELNVPIGSPVVIFKNH
ncbi:MAG TPA: DUF89 family protein [Ignisphaera sp.]|nr:DUF89 family protein [Ignisphaera sp.]